MGIAIQYCIFCQEQIPSRDVTEGKAVPRPGGYVCVACAKKAGLQAEPAPVKHATPAPRRLSAASVPAVRTTGRPTPTPASRDPHASHVGHVPHAPRPPASQAPMKVPLILGGIGLVIGILILVMVNKGGKDAPKPATTPPVADAPDPRIELIKQALEEAKQVDKNDYDIAIAAYRRAANILPDSTWAKEAEAGAKEIETARDRAAQKEFDRIKEETDGLEASGNFAWAIEEWTRFPANLLVGDWVSRIEAERKAIGERQASFEKEAKELASDVLRKAATHADQKEYEKAIQALGSYPERFKSTRWAADVAQAKARYQELAGVCPVTPPAAGLDTCESNCIKALLAGDVTAARKAWEPLLKGSMEARAKMEIEDLEDIETDRERDGAAIYLSRTHAVVIPKGLPAWHYEAKSNVRCGTRGDLEEDGKLEVFLGLDGTREDAGTLLCLSIDGTKRWEFATGAMHWNQDGLDDKMTVVGLKSADLDGDGKKEVISVSNHVRLFPCRVCVLTWEGKLVSEYWNPGHGGSPFAADLDFDGKPEVVIPFTNNDLNQTQAIACFRGNNIKGQAPPGGTDGSQMWYAQVTGAKAPLTRISWKRESKQGPATRIECEFKDGTWVLDFAGNVIQKP